MNPIMYALNEVMAVIPHEILNEVFLPKIYMPRTGMESVETHIREQVIDGRVLVNMEVMGGTETYIPLSAPVEEERIDPQTVVYHIPIALTQGRPIVQVFSVHFGLLGYPGIGLTPNYNESVLGSSLRRVAESAMQTAPAITSYIGLISNNTVLVKFSYIPTNLAILRCRLGNDDELNFIQPQNYELFSEIVVLATKAYIWRKMTVKVDEAQLIGGQALGAFKDVISDYSSAEADYKLLLKKWKKITTCFNDIESRRRHVRTVMPLI